MIYLSACYALGTSKGAKYAGNSDPFCCEVWACYGFLPLGFYIGKQGYRGYAKVQNRQPTDTARTLIHRKKSPETVLKLKGNVKNQWFDMCVFGFGVVLSRFFVVWAWWVVGF